MEFKNTVEYYKAINRGILFKLFLKEDKVLRTNKGGEG